MLKTKVGKAISRRIESATAASGSRLSITALRGSATKARGRLSWDEDAYYRRLICRREPSRAGNWIQLGHALKEAGFHLKAEAAYRRALDLLPGDADLHLQLAHLAKVRGDLVSAIALFESARELGHPDTDIIAAQVATLVRVASPPIFQELVSGAEKSGVKVYLSAPAKEVNEGQRGDIAKGLGQADYSYAFALRGFAAGLATLGIDHEVIDNPEIISDIRDRSDAATNIHLGFYPPEHIRLLKGAYNINCFAWEFDRLRKPQENRTSHAFWDQAQMLSLADELWMPSRHGVEAVQPLVSPPVRHVPSPILGALRSRARTLSPRDLNRISRALVDATWRPLSIMPRIQSTMDGIAHGRQSSLHPLLSPTSGKQPTVFLSIFNVHDYRKQIAPMIDGFLAMSRAHPDSLLLLKVNSPYRGHESANAFLMKEQIFDEPNLIPPLVSERVWLTDDILTREEMNALFDVADFYVCTSHAEGQNLPLLEAMQRGVVPVSVDHTAMADYIDAASAVVIESERRPLDLRLVKRYGMTDIQTNYVTPVAVADAMVRALDLSDEAYAEKSASAAGMVGEKYGVEPLKRELEALFERVALTQGRVQ